MKVVMMMRDTEYRDAMISMMSGFDKDIFIEIAGSGGIQRDAVIVTDIMPDEIESSSLTRIRNRTLFLSSVYPVPDREDKDMEGCTVLFKYSSLVNIMAELSSVYSHWSGNTGIITPSTKIIAVAGETDQFAAERCRSLAGQIVYTHGGSIMIIPLSYINDYSNTSYADNRGCLRRLMYMIDEGRDYLPESFIYTDTYGISYLRLEDGVNPLTSLGSSYISSLISGLGSHFDTLILDIGTCYSKTNLQLLRTADHAVFFGTGRRIRDPVLFTGTDSQAMHIISTPDAQTEAREIDDLVEEIYGRTDQKSDDSQIQNRNR